MLLAVTTTRQCVGIKIFNRPYLWDKNENVHDDVEEYIERCIREAIDLKQSIEIGLHKNIENDSRIVSNLNSDQYIEVEKLIELQSKSKSAVYYAVIIFYIYA